MSKASESLQRVENVRDLATTVNVHDAAKATDAPQRENVDDLTEAGLPIEHLPIEHLPIEQEQGSRLRVLTPDAWHPAEQRHRERVRPHVRDHVERRRAHRKHPVEDFLFTYYSYSSAKLRRWHPGAGVALLVDEDGRTPISDDRFTQRVTLKTGEADVLDVGAFLRKRERTVAFVRTLLATTLGKRPHLGCFGMHEWAMVYKLQPGEQRHEQLPLRLSQGETDAVVEKADIRCTHFDAYRFFTDDAVDLNRERPTQERQTELEQPACLHANMDVYKWAHKLAPLVPSALVLDAFVLARQIRTLDMEASPYDVRGLGYGVVPVETPQGRADYVRRQRAFVERSQELRRRLLEVLPPVTTTET